MNNPNPPLKRLKAFFSERWSGEDYPGANPRFQIKLFFQDFAIYGFLPIFAIIVFKSCETAFSSDKRSAQRQKTALPSSEINEHRSQLIDFKSPVVNASATAGIQKRSPGTLVKVRLLNVVETYSGAPVHAQVIDAGLGRNLIGGTLIGEAVPDSNFDRINIIFRHLKVPNKESLAISISARALSLNGTLGMVAQKKEEFFARAALGSSTAMTQETEEKTESTDLKKLIAKALTSGLLQEFGSESQIAKNRARVLTLKPMTEFFIELTDYFPGNR